MRIFLLGLLALTSYGFADTKYIQGGSLDGGDGSLEHPYSSFQQAEEDVSWTVLKVLASETPIGGGIALKDGQSIEGEDRARCLLVNEDSIQHNGDVIVANGDNTISGITIVSSFRAGVEALNAQNLTIENCSINRCNRSKQELPFDYNPSSTSRDFGLWGAISFFGGATVKSGIQPFNTKSGTFILRNSSFDNNARDILMGCGDSVSTSFVSETYRREYEISDCQFTNTRNSRAIQPMIYGGGYLAGVIKNCLFENIKSSDAIAFFQVNANNSHYPDRGNYDMGINEVSNCIFKNVYRSGVYFNASGNLTGTDAQIVIKDNQFISCAKHYKIDTPIQSQIEGCATGNRWQWVVEGNTIAE